MKRIAIIDSHTGGEPTRIVINGGPELGGGSITDKLRALKKHDQFRSAVVNEPRGSDVMVGAMLVDQLRTKRQNGNPKFGQSCPFLL